MTKQVSVHVHLVLANYHMDMLLGFAVCSTFRHRENEKSTDGIDLSASCSFNIQDKTAWRLAIQGQTTADRQEEEKSNTQTGTARLYCG